MKKSKIRSPRAAALGVLAIGTFAYACATPLVPEDVKLRPTTMVAGTASSRSATVGTTLQNEPAVVIRDQFGDPLPGVTVAFNASSGTQPTPATKQTDDDGRASPTTWTLPTATGTVTVTASVAGTTLGAQTFTVTLNPGPASTAAVNSTTPSSNNQSAVAGTAVPVVPQVRVSDQYGNAVPNVGVTFAVTAGGGVVAPTTAVNTDANGVARATSWTLGTGLGTNTLRATVAGIATPVTFTATGTAGTPSTIVVGGDGSSQGQTAVANTSVANAPIVLVRDANNNPVPDINVRFTIAGGNGRILTSSSDNTGQTTVDVTTGTEGTASIFAWRLGSIGANTLNVTLPSHTSVNAFVFTATGIVGPPTQVAISNQSWGFTRASTAHGGTPSVVVRDAGGNLVANRTINWTTPDANSTLSAAASSTTNSSGVAAFPRATVNWTAGATVGQTMSLVATVAGVTPALTATFTSKIVGAATQIAVAAGNNQTGPINTALSTKPAARATDANGDPVPGTSVTFAVTAGGGSVTGTPAAADSVGVATVGNWTLGSTVGSGNNTLRASLTSTPTTFVDFSASATAGAPASVQAQAGNPTSASVNATVPVSVVVRDAGGNLVSGASVTFTVTGAPTNAAITSTNPAVTNASGVATVSWRLDTLARTNQVTAVTNSVGTTLSVVGTALAASKLVITSGNNQTGAPNSTLPLAPTARATDQYNNAVSGVSVTFAPASGTVNCGSGAAASCAAITPSSGLASAFWTLGSGSGTQTLNAFLTASTSVTVSFTASTTNPCSTSQTISPGTTYNGSLTTSDCLGTGNFYTDHYDLTVPASTTRQMSITYSSAAFFPYWLSKIWTGAAWQTSIGTTGSVTQYFALGPGSYDFEAKTSTANQTGAYTLQTVLNPSLPSGCGDFLVTKGITVAHSLDLNCNYDPSTQAGTGNAASKRYWTFIPANTAMTVRMNTGTISDTYLECFDATTSTSSPTFITNCFNDDSGGSGAALMSIPTATTGRFILIRASHYNGASSISPTAGTYTLIIDP